MGIMLVYDITNEKSFENIIKWLRNIDEHANEDVERMILGNKCDMTDKRIVSKERGEAVSYYHLIKIGFLLILLQIAREYGIRFMETSAKANINIEKAFSELAEAILDQTAGKDANSDNQERVVVDRKNQENTPAYSRCCSS